MVVSSQEGSLVAPDTIIGRAHELDVVASFFDHDSAGAHGLLIEGTAGVGKSTVWHEAVRIAGTEGRVLTARASEAEARLSFTVLGDLLVPALDAEVLGGLAGRQRRALDAALLLSDGTPVRPDHRAVSLAVLAVLRALAEHGPLTIAIDDVQWVDAPSARTLVFALRRIETERVAVVAARRLEPGSSDPLDLVQTLPGGVARLALAPLDVPTLGRVLRRALDRPLPPPLVGKIHDQTDGNPFFAIEVVRALGDDPSSIHPGQPLPVPQDLEGLLRRRLSALSAEAREMSLLIAAASTPTVELVDPTGRSAATIEETVDAGVVALRGARLAFTHPLLASTVYATATARQRRRAHARLAANTIDPEERARHLALSSEGPRADVADALDDAARHARDRGAPFAAAELLELAALSTPPSSELAAARVWQSAVHLFDAGDGDGARRRLEQLVQTLRAGEQRARALFGLSFMSWGDLRRVTALMAEALDQAGDDTDLRARILAQGSWVELEACRPAPAADIARTALAIAEPLEDPFPSRFALSALATAETILGRPAGHLIERAVTLEVEPVPGESTGPSIVRGQLLLWAGEVALARDVLEAALDRFRDQGRDAGTWEILGVLAALELRAGRWNRASDHVSTALEIVRDAGRSNEAAGILATSAAIAAATGHVEEASSDGLAALTLCERNGERRHELSARAALGFLALTQGDPAAAHAVLAPAAAMCEEMGLREPGMVPFVPDAVEALVALGDVDEAERLTNRLEEQGRALDRALALATAARCRGLIAAAHGSLDLAAGQLERALAEHSRVEHPFELARTALVAGEVQRRMKQKRAARELLERARTAFDVLGATQWAAKAHAELARVGGRAPTADGLTPTEAEVARLVAQGLTNREVARSLFMSPHTVDANLRRVYRKLQVRSRTELARKL
jgi:DNA-binding CsgD family transcriptional regulator